MYKACREYRIKKHLTLAEIARDEISVKTLSAFEHGRSTNYIHIARYIDVARRRGELNELINELVKGD